jgi:3-deoxy-D-manno-octulosonic acid kinase
VIESAHIRDLRERYGLQPPLCVRADGGRILAYLPAHEACAAQVAEDPTRLAPADVGGRAPLLRILSASESLFVRPYRKGGLLRHLRGDRFRGSLRPLRELALHRRLAGLGVPVADAVAAVVLEGRGGWRGFLLTSEVLGAVDLQSWLHGSPAPASVPRGEFLQRAGAAVRRLHDAGVSHVDLHAKNLLLTPEGQVLVLDLDRAREYPGPLEESERFSNLVRLGRGIEKHRMKGLQCGTRDALRFLEGYAGPRASARRLLAEVRARLDRGLSLRRLWWRLIGEARPLPPAATPGRKPRT